MEIFAENGTEEFNTPKAYIIYYIVIDIVYFLCFIFFLFMTVVVIRKEEKPDKVILIMLTCLQLSALSKYFFYPKTNLFCL